MRRAAVVVGGVGITDDKLQIAVLVTVLHQYASASHIVSTNYLQMFVP
jgi:hypothetical protein